jgi:hypothetical protein
MKIVICFVHMNPGRISKVKRRKSISTRPHLFKRKSTGLGKAGDPDENPGCEYRFTAFRQLTPPTTTPHPIPF